MWSNPQRYPSTQARTQVIRGIRLVRVCVQSSSTTRRSRRCNPACCASLRRGSSSGRSRHKLIWAQLSGVGMRKSFGTSRPVLTGWSCLLAPICSESGAHVHVEQWCMLERAALAQALRAPQRRLSLNLEVLYNSAHVHEPANRTCSNSVVAPYRILLCTQLRCWSLY